MNGLRVGSLFAGIGGFDIGFERAGMRTAWQVEIDPYCRAILAQHFPEAKRFEDVREVGAHNLEPVDLICGGFPCTDISDAGKRAGIEGDESGLWTEFARIIGELRPRYVVVENVSALLRRGLGRVLGDLAAIGFDAEWDCVPASIFGAPHPRDRIWLVAYPEGGDGPAWNLLEAGEGWRASSPARGLPGLAMAPRWEPRGFWGAAQPPSPLLVDGLPGRVAEIGALGNALVPQIAEWIGHRITEAERMSEAA